MFEVAQRCPLRNLIRTLEFAGIVFTVCTLVGCRRPDSERLKIGVAFETLQTEYWVASFDALAAELERRDLDRIEAIADGDANRQLDQVHAFIARGVDGIIIAPKDATTVIPMIRVANRAGIPIVLYNRPPAENAGHSVTVVADNYRIARETVMHMARRAAESGQKHKAMVLIGDLGDINAIDRRNGFEDAVKQYPEIIEVVARVPTDWNQEKALSGATNALQVHPDIRFIFSSSDFLFPSLVSALKTAGKYKKVGTPEHVLLGGFDGDSLAYQMLKDGYLDADGVQDVYFECKTAVEAILRLREGKPVPAIIRDPGFVIDQKNLEKLSSRMWGAQTTTTQ